jgi:serine/threonine protein phosphatase 1
MKLDSPLTFAIGDIHGQHLKLLELLRQCGDRSGDFAAKFVFLGDYIDRGPDSRAVIETLIEFETTRPDRVICLRGNHEAALSAIAGGDMSAMPSWLNKNGGDRTLASYGVADPAALPADHLAWMASLSLSHDDGMRFFVHAGVDPSRPLDAQHERDLLWIREPFLSSERDYGRLVVHGHTPQKNYAPELRPNRLNLDTAAAYGGPITAAVFIADRTTPVEYLRAC